MNLLEEFLAQLGIYVEEPQDDIPHTSDYSEFVYVDGEEGDYGIVKYYGETLLAVRFIEGGDMEHTKFTAYAKEILAVKAKCWLEKEISSLKVYEE
jgi:hypothetical protein